MVPRLHSVKWRDVHAAAIELLGEVGKVIERLFRPGEPALQIAVVGPDKCYAGFYAEGPCAPARLVLRGRAVEVAPGILAACTFKVMCPERLPRETELEYDVYAYGPVSVFPGSRVVVAVAEVICEWGAIGGTAEKVRRAAELWADAEGLELSFMNSRRALDMDAEADVRRAVEELAGPGAEVAKAMSGEEVIALLREAEEALGTVVRAVEGCWPAAGYAYAVIKALP